MILAVTGLQREARILAGPDIEVALGGAGLDRRVAGKQGVISIGIAGALAVGLRPGTWVVADAIHDGGASLPTDPRWTAALLKRLPASQRGVLLGVDRPVATAAGA